MYYLVFWSLYSLVYHCRCSVSCRVLLGGVTALPSAVILLSEANVPHNFFASRKRRHVDYYVVAGNPKSPVLLTVSSELSEPDGNSARAVSSSSRRSSTL
jgi:hypothetical protein